MVGFLFIVINLIFEQTLKVQHSAIFIFVPAAWLGTHRDELVNGVTGKWYEDDIGINCRNGRIPRTRYHIFSTELSR